MYFISFYFFLFVFQFVKYIYFFIIYEEEKIDNSFSSNSDFFLLNEINDENLKKKGLVQSKIINEHYEMKYFEDFCNSRKKVNGNIYLFSLKELELLI